MSSIRSWVILQPTAHWLWTNVKLEFLWYFLSFSLEYSKQKYTNILEFFRSREIYDLAY